MQPLVTIGLPLFNEERFLRKSLDAILAQDYENLEILISDNASTDQTQEICEEYAAGHANIQYHRFSENMGPAKNFDEVRQRAQGQYFMWAAGHDLWSGNYVSECVRALEAYPRAVIAFGSGSWIDENDAPFSRESGWTDTRGMDVIARYFTVLWGNMHPVLGLMRRSELARCPIENTVGTDLIILTRMALAGDFIHATAAHWSRREFRVEQSYNDKLDRYRSSAYGLAASRLQQLFPLATLPFSLAGQVLASGQKLWVKMLIILLLLPSFPIRYVAGKLKPR